MNYLSHPKLRAAAYELIDGGVIAYPTEGVWGLGCDPFNERAVQTILSLKQRPVRKGLILVAASMNQIQPLLEGLSEEQLARLTESWPGPFTWLLPHQGKVPAWISGEFDSVAVRVSAHPVVSALCTMVGGPIVSTSANPQAKLAARHNFQVKRYFGQNLTLAPGVTFKNAKPSQIRDLISGEVLRA